MPAGPLSPADSLNQISAALGTPNDSTGWATALAQQIAPQPLGFALYRLPAIDADASVPALPPDAEIYGRLEFNVRLMADGFDSVVPASMPNRRILESFRQSVVGSLWPQAKEYVLGITPRFNGQSLGLRPVMSISFFDDQGGLNIDTQLIESFATPWQKLHSASELSFVITQHGVDERRSKIRSAFDGAAQALGPIAIAGTAASQWVLSPAVWSAVQLFTKTADQLLSYALSNGQARSTAEIALGPTRAGNIPGEFRSRDRFVVRTNDGKDLAEINVVMRFTRSLARTERLDRPPVAHEFILPYAGRFLEAVRLKPGNDPGDVLVVRGQTLPPVVAMLEAASQANGPNFSNACSAARINFSSDYGLSRADTILALHEFAVRGQYLVRQPLFDAGCFDGPEQELLRRMGRIIEFAGNVRPRDLLSADAMDNLSRLMTTNQRVDLRLALDQFHKNIEVIASARTISNEAILYSEESPIASQEFLEMLKRVAADGLIGCYGNPIEGRKHRVLLFIPRVHNNQKPPVHMSFFITAVQNTERVGRVRAKPASLEEIEATCLDNTSIKRSLLAAIKSASPR